MVTPETLRYQRFTMAPYHKSVPKKYMILTNLTGSRAVALH